MATSYKEVAQAKLKDDDYDPVTRFLYVPHTVSALLIGLGVLVWCSGALDPDPENAAHYKSGVAACALVYVGYSAVQGPTSVMVRPHPVLWKTVHGIVMIYLLALVFLLMQGKDAARQLFKHLDPALGVPLPERSYGGDCRLWLPEEQDWNWETIKGTVFDEFVIAHTLGWWGKALVMRNYWMLWTCSIGFELMELTFGHWLANFNECWWDSWILDVAVCNLAGMLAGMATVKYFGSKKYNWQGMSKQTGIYNKARRGVLQFTPKSVEVWQWSEFSSPKRFLQSLFIVACVMTCELNAFFLKTLFWIKPSHWLNVVRLTIWWLLALPAIKEAHQFLNSDRNDIFNALGSNAWLGLAVLSCEVLIIIKFGHGEFTEPFPDNVKFAWGFGFGLLVAGLTIWQASIWIRQYMRSAAPKSKKNS